jgi:hypothetical protein
MDDAMFEATFVVMRSKPGGYLAGPTPFRES